LREPSQGAILLDGVDYWEFSSASWHRTVALVEQEAFLFHDTLANNIAFGLTGVSETEITDALRVANLHEILETLPQGLQTIVGERGTKLSGGQRQRLAIARAVVRQPKVLVLDEATSHLDTVTEQLVQQALTQAMQGRTTLVIAHRLSTIRHADWIVVFNQGKVEDQGTWEQLSQRKGLFARMAITG
jgi:ABC-type multidrug transport system fused ATPase/permease subunit